MCVRERASEREKDHLTNCLVSLVCFSAEGHNDFLQSKSGKNITSTDFVREGKRGRERVKERAKRE